MLLSEIKDLSQHHVILESSIPIHLLMILNEIQQGGGCNNTIHYSVLLQICELFRFGRNYSVRNLSEFSTPKERLDELKALKPELQVDLANWAMEQLTLQDAEESLPKSSPALDLVAWIAHVKQAQR